MPDPLPTAVVEVAYEHPTDGRRAMSFGVRADTVRHQVQVIADLLPAGVWATWTVRPGSDDTSGHRPT